MSTTESQRPVIVHIARGSDWEQALQAGVYAMSTVDRTLDDEGYIHASYRGQLPGVMERHYAQVEGPLVMLTIDPERLSAELREEAPPGRVERYPHIYGPLNTAAVIEVEPLRRDDAGTLIVPW